MKKTLTVNLGGTVYHIDEDAYRLLDNYLNNLRLHFKKQQGAEEIVNDMENRIAELFSEKISDSNQVITITDVEEVITRMGRPEDFGDTTYDTESGKGSKSTDSQQSDTKTTTARRCFRDPDNKMLGGVAAGFAAYLGWDITLVRVLMVMLLFIPYCPIIILYLIGWIFIPEARTAAEKLSMRGEAITVENIGKTVTDGFERVADGMNNFVNSGKPRTFIQKVGDIFVSIVACLLKVILFIAAIVLCPFVFVAALILIVALVGIIALALGMGGVLFSALPSYPFIGGTSMTWDSPLPFLSCILIVLFLAIPIFALAHTILRTMLNWSPMPKGLRISMLITWILTIPLLLLLILGWLTPDKRIETHRATHDIFYNEPVADAETAHDTLKIDSIQH